MGIDLCFSVRRMLQNFVYFKKLLTNIVWLNSLSAKFILNRHLKLVYDSGKLECVSKSRLALICMVRDENELLKFWINHHSSLECVRRLIIIDHFSVEPIKIQKGISPQKVEVRVYRFQHNAYLQAHVTNRVAKLLAKETKDLIILPLDADEFLTNKVISDLFASRRKFGCLEWLLVWPTNIYKCLSDRIDESWELNVAGERFGGHKHFMHSSKVHRGWKWGQGNHRIFNPLGLVQKLVVIGELIHIPVRSYEQIKLKFSQSDSSHKHKLLNRTDSKGERIIARHWNLNLTNHFSKSQIIDVALAKYTPPGGELPKSTPTTWKKLINK